MDFARACQACKKQAATVHITDISPDGEKCERHLCEACAQKVGVSPKPPAASHVAQVLSAFVQGSKISAQQIAELACPECELTFVEFRNCGLLGCPADYDAFEKALVPLIERAHQGASHHIGKVPRRLGVPRPAESELIQLRRALSRAVNEEHYEQAARLRDHIRSLESQ